MVQALAETAFWILRQGDHVHVDLADPTAVFWRAERAVFAALACPPLRVGTWRGQPCYAVECTERELDVLSVPPPGEWMLLRALFDAAGRETFTFAGRAFQLLSWQKNHHFCGRCGQINHLKSDELAMLCPACGHLVYPRISPAAMVLVRRADEFLLARSPHFKPGVFSALAGFVEAGETVEQCAVREVREEVGVEITNLRYFDSQPWPFPDSLMLAFFADYVSGVITPEPTEIEAAGWYRRSALPILPEPMSIARRLIDAACQEVDAGRSTNGRFAR